MRYQPFLFLLVAFILGILTEEFFHGSVLLYSLGGTISLFTSYYFIKIKNGPRIFVHSGLFGVFFFLGGLLHSLNTVSAPKFINSKTEISFKLQKKLNSNEKNRRYEVTALHEDNVINIVLAIPKSQKELDFEHYYQAKVYLNLVDKPKYDFQFDYSKYLSRRNIHYQAYVYEDIKTTKRTDLSFSEKIKQIRWSLLQKIDRLGVDSKTREFIKGIILADRTEFDRSVVQDFSKTGLVHILAISGSHMVILFFVFFGVINWILSPRRRKLSIIISLILIWFFSVFIDYGSSVMRSCIMITIYYIYVLLERQSSLLHAVALAGLVLLFWDTQQLFDVGFQLSFAAVLGIFWLYQPLLKCFPKLWLSQRVSKFFIEILCVTFSAQVATLPLVLFYFHQFSPVALVSNLLIIPLAEILIIGALILTIMITLGNIPDKIIKLYDVMVQWVLKLIHYLSGWVDDDRFLGFSAVEVLLSVICIYFLRFVVLRRRKSDYLKFSYALAFFLVMNLVLNWSATQNNEVLEHNYFKKNIISVKSGRNVIFIINDKLDLTKVKDYVVKPYVSSRRISNFRIVEVNTSKSRFVNVDNKLFEIK